MPCTGCGDCCEHIVIGNNRRALIHDAMLGGESARFVLTHWHAESHREDGAAVYWCDAFDPVARRCTEHDKRPPVCRNYPFYESPSLLDAVLPEVERYPACGYVAEALAEIACGG